MIDLQRMCIVALLILSFIIWQTWKKDESLQLHEPLSQRESSLLEKNYHSNSIITSYEDLGEKIKIKTDVLELTVNTCGGNIEQAFLLTYPKKLHSKEPVQLLKTTSNFIYQAQSGLVGSDGPDNPKNGACPLYNVDQKKFLLFDNQKQLVIPLTYKDNYGNIFTKTFILKRNEYKININYTIHNSITRPIELSIFGQLKQSIDLILQDNFSEKENNFSVYSFRGVAYSTLNKKYAKYKLNDIKDNNNLNVLSKEGWIAMLQQYFVTAWIPCNNENNLFYTKNLGNGIAAVGYKSEPIVIQPGQTKQLKSALWIGPKIQDSMASVAPNLDLTVDYGWLWFIAQPLFKLLKLIHSVLNNWGFSIITITFFVRGITYPLTKAQYVSVAKMHVLQPKIKIIQQRLGNDKQRISQAMLALYREEKVNPFGGCLPLLVQMPIFLALYYMLIGSVELRHAPFAFWIYDLSEKDPYYILPILMGITMFCIQKMSPSSVNDTMQNKIIIFMPIIFTVFFLWFPSGLVLYYVVSNIVTIFQQKLIYLNLEKRGLYKHNTKKNKRI